MDMREQKGLEIAATTDVKRYGQTWLVPSQGGRGHYTVNMTGDGPTCNCQDHEQRGIKCKHIYAVEFTVRRETTTEIEVVGCEATITQTITQTVCVTETEQVTYRETYPQNWTAYNSAQTNEKRMFLDLLGDLCSGVPDPVQTFGRPRLCFSDMVFSAAFKVYSTISTRRFISDLADAHEKGYISKLPHFNSILNYLEMESLTPVLRELIQKSSLPLKSVETDFAVDASGFSTCRYVRWFDAKYGKEQSQHEWVKMHLMCGVQTNIVTSVEITGSREHDCPYLPPLVNTTARNFAVKEVSADKAYLSKKNVECVVKVGGTPYVPFKENSTGNDAGNVLWERLWHFYSFNRDDFFAHYHKRSNVESTFSMIKRKFGDSLRSKTQTALTNEALLKVLCHNICVLIQSIFELGIVPTFWAETALAQ
jgi:transposase